MKVKTWIENKRFGSPSRSRDSVALCQGVLHSVLLQLGEDGFAEAAIL